MKDEVTQESPSTVEGKVKLLLQRLKLIELKLFNPDQKKADSLEAKPDKPVDHILSMLSTSLAITHKIQEEIDRIVGEKSS